MSTEEKMSLVVGIGVLAWIIIMTGVDTYRDYHARMHSIPVWGCVVENRVRSGQHYSAKIEYFVNNEVYELYPQVMYAIHKGDSVIVYYDTTCYKRAFLPMRNHNVETAFFMSEKRMMSMWWERDYEKFQNNLEKERKAHRERQHFYDHWCKDD